MAIFRLLLLEYILPNQLADLHLPQRHLVAKNGNFQIATVRVHIGKSTGRSTPPIEASSGQQWQFEIYTVRAHIGPQGIQWLRMAILDLYCQSSYWQIQWPTGNIQIYPQSTVDPSHRHLVVMNGNFRFILLELILADQLADLPFLQRHLVVMNVDFRLLLLELILADQLADLPSIEASSGHEWQCLDCYCQSTYWQINWQIYPSHRGIQWT